MTINKTINGKEVILALEGSLDTTTAPILDNEVASIKNVDTLIFDFEKLDYLSSAGLRILLVAQKKMDNNGKLIIRHVNKMIMDIFSMTGFINILTIE